MARAPPFFPHASLCEKHPLAGFPDFVESDLGNIPRECRSDTPSSKGEAGLDVSAQVPERLSFFPEC